MLHQFSRNELAIGEEGLKILQNATVVVLGIGGVGSFAVEALVRSGVGNIVMYDKDTIDITNVNRQIHATLDTLDEPKTTTMKQRLLTINPACNIVEYQQFVEAETIPALLEQRPDFIIDAMDTISIKSLLIAQAIKQQVPLISSMGMANKMDPTQIEITNIWSTKYDPVAKNIRKYLKEQGLMKKKIMVVATQEKPIKQQEQKIKEIGNQNSAIRKQSIPPSSNALVPSVAGIFCASYVINELLTKNKIGITRVGD